MPFLSPSALDAFILNPGDYHVGLHDGLVPTLANELHVENAPGYAHQAATLGPSLSFPNIVFGPASGHWPLVRSISVREGVAISNPLAYAPLPPFRARPGDSYTVPNGHLGATLLRPVGDGAGWTLTPAQFHEWLLQHTAGRLSGADMDPGGVLGNPGASLPDDAAIVHGSVRLYDESPLRRPAGLREPLRELSIGAPVSIDGTPLDAHVLPWYWSPLYHSLVTLYPAVSNTGPAGTATHWALDRDGSWTIDLSTLAYSGPLTPSIHVGDGEALVFPPRGLRVTMPVE